VITLFWAKEVPAKKINRKVHTTRKSFIIAVFGL